MINLIIDGYELNVEVIVKPNNRNLYIRAKKPNIVSITSPRRLSTEEIKKYIIPNLDSIKAHLLKETTNTIHILGKEYDCIVTEANEAKIRIVGNRCNIYTPFMDDDYIKGIIYKLYEKILKDYVYNNLERIRREMRIPFIINVEYKIVKTYFGECFPKQNRIILSIALAKYDAKLIESVIYHELAHFKYQNHSKEFYDYLELHFKDYKKYQKELKRIKYNDIYD